MPKLIKEKIDIFSFVIKSKLDPYWKRFGERSGYGRYIGARLPSGHVVMLDEKKSFKSPEEYNFKRLWLVSSSWARDGILELHAQAVRQWMRTQYSILDSKEFDGIFIDYILKKFIELQ